MTTRRIRISKPIRALMDAIARFVCLEGALRSAKTWGALFKVRRSLDEHPGIRWVVSRWKDDDVKTKLLPEWRIICAFMGLDHGAWNAAESCYDFRNGSRCYVISIKAAENDSRYSKVRGYTVSGWYIDQLEEVPRDVFHEVKLRLSQPGFPHQLIATPNPVHHGHWIAEEFPEDNKRPNHLYISSSIWDNAANLDATTIEAAEAMYPVGHPMRGPKLEGKRGANLEGTPVYAGCFNTNTHVANGLEPYPYVDILVGWDFGAKHPAAVFAQMLPWGAFWIHGGILGSDVPLEQFAPFVLQTATEWFPGRSLMHCGDPAGSHRNSQGVSLNAVSALRDVGVALVVQPDSNTNTVRAACVQTLQGYMLGSVKRFVTDGSVQRQEQLEGRSLPVALAPHAEAAFRLNPRFLMHSPRGTGPVPVLLEAFGAGYIWDDDHRRASQTDGNLRMPKKDGFFEHPMNATEYIVHNFFQPVRMAPATLSRNFKAVQKEHYRVSHQEPSKAEKVALRRAQLDREPDETRGRRMRVSGSRGFRSRGGY